MPLSAVDELFYQYNAWWEPRPDLIGIRPRANLVERIRALLSAKRILHLTGLRRVAKTTLTRLLADRLIGEGALPQSILCVSMDDYLLRKQSITDTGGASRTIHKISVDRPVVLLFDEITYQAGYQQAL